jgi:hypothetical protein
MFKALDTRKNTEIVILDSKWLSSIDQLRELDRQDFLVCQGCKQPVRVRAGEQRLEHFAHKHLADCDYATESAILCNSRAILYEWLVGKFGDRVTIEKKVDGEGRFRPIDCWVETDARIFAYWIFDSGLRSGKREILQSHLEKRGIQVTWVFAGKMLHTGPDHPDKLVLSTTEREFIRPSAYDKAYGSDYIAKVSSRSLDKIFGYRPIIKGSLHYLDSENRSLHTFRGLSLYHEPQVYKGHYLCSTLEELFVSPKTGEFVHNGEHDEFMEYEKWREAAT